MSDEIEILSSLAAEALTSRMESMQLDNSTIAEYLGEEVARAHEATIEAIRTKFEDAELQDKEISAAMKEIDSRIFTHRFYHEAPDDIFELFVIQFKMFHRLNNFRRISRRCMRVVETVATRISQSLTLTGCVDSFPEFTLKRFKVIKVITCQRITC